MKSVYDIIEELLQFDSCTISDALDKLQIRGVALGLQPLTIKKKITSKINGEM